jgi:hypothetical protein
MTSENSLYRSLFSDIEADGIPYTKGGGKEMHCVFISMHFLFYLNNHHFPEAL